jgi:type IV pilus assembly protein PilB
MKIRRFRADDSERRVGLVPPAAPLPHDPAPVEPGRQPGLPSVPSMSATPGAQQRGDAIGQILLAQGVITEEQLEQALEIQRRSGGQLGRVLVKMGAMSEGQLARALVRQFGAPSPGEEGLEDMEQDSAQSARPTAARNAVAAPPERPRVESIPREEQRSGPSPRNDPSTSAREDPIGQILLGQGVITEAHLRQALEIQRRSGGQLSRVLVKMGVLTEGQLARALARQWERVSGGETARLGTPASAPSPGRTAGTTPAANAAAAPRAPAPTPPAAAAFREEPPARSSGVKRDVGQSTQGDPNGDPIGQFLLAQGVVTQEQLDQALEEQRKSGGQLSRVLIKMGVITAGQLARAFARQWDPSAAETSRPSAAAEAAPEFDQTGDGAPPSRAEAPIPPSHPDPAPAKRTGRFAAPARRVEPTQERAEPIEVDASSEDESSEEAPMVPWTGSADAGDAESSAEPLSVEPAAPVKGDSFTMPRVDVARPGASSRDGSSPGTPGKGDSSRIPQPRVDPVGQILLTQGAVTQEQLQQALEIQRQSGGQLSRILVKMGAVSEAQLARALARQWGRQAGPGSAPGGTATETARPSAPVRPATPPAPRESAPPARPSAPVRPVVPSTPRQPAPARPPLLPPDAVSPDVAKGDVGKGRIDTIGQILLTQQAITNEQLSKALEIQRQSGGRLGRVLVETGIISEAQLAKGLAQQWGRPFTDLTGRKIDKDVARLIPPYLGQRHGVLALERKKNRLVVAMSDPANVVAIDDIRLLSGMDVEIVIASADDIARVQSDLYGIALDVEELLRQTTSSEPEIAAESRSDEMSLERLQTMVEEAPIIRVVNQIITQAIQSQASDIHLEPHRKEVKVRFRIDGILQDVMSPPKAVQPALVSRVKILASMDIAERRLPQDGHINVRVEGKEFDLRVSTLPTVQGEKVVIRILDQSAIRVSLNKIGFSAAVLAQWEDLVDKPYGMIIVTGPTGSGKTTTLYTSLARINKPDINIVSVEDPVEYQMPRVNQVQVNPKAGLTFANGLRSILRQDPDVVLIGEIRDKETAEIAIQASMTGHLVLSTLHTNDAPGAVTRLRDMGIEPFLITSSLLGVLAQRLVRVICPKCKEAYTPPSEALHRLGLDPQEHKDVTLYRGKGCDFCRNTGYKGRLGVFELMTMNEELRNLVLRGVGMDQLREAAVRNGMRILGQDGVQKVLEGITTFEELLRVVFVNEAQDTQSSPDSPVSH